MKEPKYILIVGDGKSLRCPTITGNNKAELIRWAREECIRATTAGHSCMMRIILMVILMRNPF